MDDPVGLPPKLPDDVQPTPTVIVGFNSKRVWRSRLSGRLVLFGGGLGLVIVLVTGAVLGVRLLAHRHGSSSLASTTQGNAQHNGGTQQAAAGAEAPSASTGHTATTPNSGTTPATGTSKASSGGSNSGGGQPPGGSPGGGSGSTNPPSTVTKHYSANTDYNQSLAVSLGFTVVDIAGSTSHPSDTKAIVDALPSGVQALVWTGNLDNTNCTTPGFTAAQFQALVNGLAGDSKVFGYFLSDEPHPKTCTSAASDIKSRADYIHAHAAGQEAFIVVLDGSNQCGSSLGCEYNALQPANTHVDLIGLDPYPCHYDGSGNSVPCDNSKINTAVSNAEANGIGVANIVPVFQTFGQAGRTDGQTVYYRTPTAAELTSMLSVWAGLVPKPAMDYAYTFGVQCSASCPSPQALANQPSLQTVIKSHNGV